MSVRELGIEEACFSWEVEGMVPVLQLGPHCLFMSFIRRLLMREAQSPTAECRAVSAADNFTFFGVLRSSGSGNV